MLAQIVDIIFRIPPRHYLLGWYIQSHEHRLHTTPEPPVLPLPILNDKKGDTKKALWLTVALGTIFLFFQGYEYHHAEFGFADNIYTSTFFMATGFHGFHVLVGTIFLMGCGFRALAQQFTPKSLALSVLYRHLAVPAALFRLPGIPIVNRADWL